MAEALLSPMSRPTNAAGAPPIEVRAPDGTIVQFPADTPIDVMERAMQQEYGGPLERHAQPTHRPSSKHQATPQDAQSGIVEAELDDGTILEFPAGTSPAVIQRVAKEETEKRKALGITPAAQPELPEDARDATGVPGGTPSPAQAPRSWRDAAMDAADYADDTISIIMREGRRGLSHMVGAPVDLVNAGLRALGLPVSDTPFLGGNFNDAVIGAPATAAAAMTGGSAEGPVPQDAIQRVAGRVGREVGASLPLLGGSLALGARTTAEAARNAGPLTRMFVAPAATAPGELISREIGAATASGLGAGIANEAVGNPQSGDNFWSDFLGSLAGVGVAAIGDSIIGAGRNALAALRSDPRMMDDVAAQEVVDRIINNSTDMGRQFDQTGRVDAAPLARQLRSPSQVEQIVPGYTANIGDRTGDPQLMTLVQNQDALSPGAATARRIANERAIDAAIATATPTGDPAQFRAALEANRDAQIAEALDAEELARAIFGEAEQAVQPSMREATARGSSLRSGLQAAADANSARVSEAFRPIKEAAVEVPIAPLAERFGAVTEDLPLNDRTRFMPSEASVPKRLLPPEPDAPVPTGLLDASGNPITRAPAPVDGRVPLREVTSTRSGLSDDIRAARAARQNQAARVATQYRDEIDEYMDAILPPQLRSQYETARKMRFDHGERFERPGTGIGETLRPREGGGYALDDSAVPGRFAQPDQGNLNDLRALLREAGSDPRVRNSLADEVLADVQTRGLIERPQQLQRYMDERQVLLGEFPELRDQLQRAGVAKEYLTDIEKASAATQKRLTTPGRLAQANYLKYGDEATVDAVRNLTSGPKPREATKELLEAAGGTAEARQNARAALWEVVKTKKFSAPNAAGGERWSPRKLKEMFDDPKIAAVAEELWSDDPKQLADVKELFAALAGAEGSVRTRAPNTSGTPQALTGKFDPALSITSLASRARSVQRGFMSPSIALVDVAATWLRRRSVQVQARAIDTLASAAFNNPDMAADLLERFNPADYAAKRAMISQKYGVRATQVLNLLDEIIHEDETIDAVTGDEH